MSALATRAARAVDAYLAPAPAARPAVLRILVGGYAVAATLVLAPEYLGLADRNPRRFAPVGVASVLDQPLGTTAVRVLLAGTLLLGIAFTTGWRFRVTGPAFAAAFLALTTYRVAWGQIFHTENLAVLHVAVLACTRSADALSLDARRARTSDPTGGGGRPQAPLTGYGWPPRLMMALTAAAYFLAGVAKLRIGGWAWLGGDVLRNQIAFDNLRKIVVGDVHSPFAAGALDHRWIFGPAAWFSLAVELGAPLALLRGPPRLAWMAAAWLFHVGILALMAIVFAYPLTGIAFACFLPAERALAPLRTRFGAVSPPPR
jgi:hypothetical protein